MWWFLFLFLNLSLSRCFSWASSAYDDPCLNGATLDIILALDNTGSMRPSQDYIRKTLPSSIQALKEKLPKSRFGLLTFNDEDEACGQPLFKEIDNYGVRLEFKLKSNISEIEKGLAAFNPTYGDLFAPEDAMGALLVAARGKGVGWRNDLKEHYHRVVIVLTDAPFRYPGDRKPYCPTNELKKNDGNGVYDHTREMYPTKGQVLKALKKMNILPLFITLNDPEGLNHQHIYDELLREWKIGGATASGKNSQDLINLIPDNIRNIICAQTELPPAKLEPAANPSSDGMLSDGQLSDDSLSDDQDEQDVPPFPAPQSEVPSSVLPTSDIPSSDIPSSDIVPSDIPSLDASTPEVPPSRMTLKPVAVAGIVVVAALAVGAVAYLIKCSLPSTLEIMDASWENEVCDESVRSFENAVETNLDYYT